MKRQSTKLAKTIRYYFGTLSTMDSVKSWKESFIQHSSDLLNEEFISPDFMESLKNMNYARLGFSHTTTECSNLV